jgi:hypothetical protein
MNIFQKYAQFAFPASVAVLEDDFDCYGNDAIEEITELKKWLWDFHGILVVVSFGPTPRFTWRIESDDLIHTSNGKTFETPQQAFIDCFENLLTLHDFLKHFRDKNLWV